LKAKLVKSLAALSVVSLTLLGVGIASSQANQSTGQLSVVGERAFEDITTCLTSGKNKALDVFYLIDNSGSLAYTDVDEIRTEVLSNSLEGLASFSEQGIKVSYAAALFNAQVEPIQNWTELTKSSQSKTLSSAVNNKNIGGYTDWEEGLEFAKNQLDSRSNSCKMLIWFTDGGINPDNSYEAVFESLANLCRAGISDSDFGSNSNYGLVSDIRESQISLFGVLYQNDRSTLAEFKSQYGSDAQDRFDLEQYLMSFMIPLIEGKGEIGPDTAFWPVPKPGPIQCGELDASGFAPAGQSNGAFLNAQDPISLAFQFLKLQSQITGGAGVPIVDGKFQIKPGTAAFRIITSDTNWSLTGPEGSEVSASASAPGDVLVSDSAGVQTLDFEVRRESQFLGEWKIDFDASERAELYVYSGLTIELDRDKVSQVIADRENTLTGMITPTANFSDLPVDLSVFEGKTLTLEVLENGVRTNANGVEIDVENNGQFKISKFIPSQIDGDVELWITLNLGGDFQPVSSRFTLAAIEATALAIPASDVVKLSTLEGPTGIATGLITVNGPTAAESSDFCLAGTDLRTDDAQTAAEKKDRLAGFAWAFDGQPAAGSDVCFTVAQGETKTIAVEVTNPTQANAQVVSMRNTLSRSGQAEYSAPLRFEFETKTQGNSAVTIGVIALLLLLGILIPLLLLYLFNRLTTRFMPLENTYRAEYPIVMTPGIAPKIIDGRGQGERKGIQVGPQDFVAQVDQPASPELNTGLGLAKGRVPLFPLLATWYELQAQEGQRVLTMKSSGDKNPKVFSNGLASELSPNMNDNWALSFSDSDLLKPEEEQLPGRLVVFAAMSNLQAYQSRVTDILQTPGIADRVAELRSAAKSDLTKDNKKPKPRRQKQAAALPDEGSLTLPTLPTSAPGSGKLAPPSLPSSGGMNSGPASPEGFPPTPPPSKPASGKLAPPPPPSF
jgi:hypothetical protein